MSHRVGVHPPSEGQPDSMLRAPLLAQQTRPAVMQLELAEEDGATRVVLHLWRADLMQARTLSYGSHQVVLLGGAALLSSR